MTVIPSSSSSSSLLSLSFSLSHLSLARSPPPLPAPPSPHPELSLGNRKSGGSERYQEVQLLLPPGDNALGVPGGGGAGAQHLLAPMQSRQRGLAANLLQIFFPLWMGPIKPISLPVGHVRIKSRGLTVTVEAG